jgi:hypothetical protein
VTGRFATGYPELVDRLVFFGPITRREPEGQRIRLPAWRPISLEDQWIRFTETVPPGEPPVLLRRHFKEWGERYLRCRPAGPHTVTAGGKGTERAVPRHLRALAEELAYDPSLVHAPVSIVRGEWDGMCTDGDALWLFEALSASAMRRDVSISHGTHLMHLEASRYALYHEAEAFLSAGDLARLAD